jgi:hypothetical protein
LLLPLLWSGATFETIRRTVVTVAVRVEELKGKIKLASPAIYPHAALLTAMTTPRLPPHAAHLTDKTG